MKRKFTLILPLLFMTMFCYGQLVISEISYNPAESGADSLEYVEIVNVSGGDLNLDGYTMGGVTLTFPDMMVSDGEYIVISVNAAALTNVFGASSIQWEDGGLSNGGEGISIRDASGTVIDTLVYDDTDPWPLEADQGGPSLELCDLTSDNALGSNWGASVTDIELQINGINVFGSPGLPNAVTCDVVIPSDTVVVSNNVFTPGDITIEVGETVLWENQEGNHNVNGTTATYPNNPESFGNGAASADAWTYTYTFNTVGVYDYQCDPHVGLGMVGTVTVVDPNNPIYTPSTIAEITTIDADGNAVSEGSLVEISGTVYGVNLGSGVQFTVIDDANDGIQVFSFDPVSAYVVNESDVITVRGMVDQFNGLIQLRPDSILLNSTGATLVTPAEVTVLDESTESQLITIKNLTLVDPAQWSGTGGGGDNIEITDGVNTYLMRLDAQTNLYGSAAPVGPFNVVGIGGQFDNSAPYTEGYQILPRYLEDVTEISSTGNLFDGKNVKIFPNPASNMLFLQSEVPLEQVHVYNSTGVLLHHSEKTNEINVSRLIPGLYMVCVISGNSNYTIPFVKE